MHGSISTTLLCSRMESWRTWKAEREKMLCRMYTLNRKKTLQVLFGIILVNIGIAFYVLTSDDLLQNQRPTRQLPTIARHWIVTPTPTDIDGTCDVINKLFPTWSVITYQEDTVTILRCKSNNRKTIAVEKIKQFWWEKLESYSNLKGRGRAYYTAIKLNADAIYVTEDVRRLGHLQRHPFSLSGSYTGLTFAGPTKDLPPGVHFGCYDSEDPVEREYDLCSLPTPVIQANAYYPVTGTGESNLNVCVPGTPPIVLPRYESLLPIDVTDALYRKEAFWALPFSAFESSNDKWTWTYLVQKTVMEFDFTIQVTAMTAKAISKQYMDLSDTAVEIDQLVKGFQTRSDSILKSLYTLFTKTMVGLDVSAGLIQKQMEWLKSMHQLEAALEIWSNTDKLMINCFDKAMFYPWKSFGANTSLVEVPNTGKINKKHNYYCEAQTEKVTNLGQPWVQFRNIALIVIYKRQLDFNTLPFVETLYRPFFPIMVHCSAASKSARKTIDKTGWEIIHLEYAANQSYDCLKLALHLRLPVDGFLFLAEDVLFSVREIPNLPLSQVWVPTPHLRCSSRRTACNVWYRSTPTLDAKVLAVNKELDYLGHPLAMLFKKRRQQFLGHEDVYVIGLTDFYYLPYGKAQEVNTLLEPYLTNDVPDEVAIPTLLTCLTKDKPPHFIPSYSGLIWKEAIDSLEYIPLLLKGNMTFLNSIQWNRVHERDPKYVNSYCSDILPFMHTPQIKL